MPAWTGIVIMCGWVLLGLGLLLSVWALAWDLLGPRPRRRCPRCWYDMRAAPGLLCPECGRTAPSDRALRRARLRWVTAAGGMVLAVVGASATQSERIIRSHWEPVIPSGLLVRLIDTPDPSVPAASDTAERLRSEMWRRYEAGQLGPESKRIIAGKQLALLGPLVLSSRPQWPEGVPIVVWFSSTITGPLPRELRTMPRFSGAVGFSTADAGLPIASPRRRRPFPENPSAALIGCPPAGTDQLVFDVEITEGGHAIWSGPVTLPVRVQGTVDQVIKPVRSDTLERTVRSMIIDSFRLTADGRWANLKPPEDLPEETALALSIEVLDGKEPAIATTYVFVSRPKGSKKGFSMWRRAKEGLWRPATVLRLLPTSTTGPLRVRVRGDGVLALRDPAATSYWAGDLVIEVPGR